MSNTASAASRYVITPHCRANQPKVLSVKVVRAAFAGPGLKTDLSVWGVTT